MNVLICYPPNVRSVYLETVCATLIEAGHKVVLLTYTPKTDLHEVLEKLGVQTYAYVRERKPTWKFFVGHIRHLIFQVRKHKIDIVWSHLSEANLIACFAQKFIKAKVTVFRHHDESTFYALYGKKFNMVRNRREVFVDGLINRLARRIVVLSNQTLNTIRTYEKCDLRKLIVSPLIYDFSRYEIPPPGSVAALRARYPAALLLIMVSRMVESKQHLPAFQMMQKLVQEGLDIKMLVMDDGPLKGQLEKWVADQELRDRIIFTGFRKDFTHFMAAADLLIHPSLTEASNNVVKEMGLLKKAVAVCTGVGDFDDYITGGYNGFILTRDNLDESLEDAVRQAYANKQLLATYGENLHKEVLNRFSNTAENKQQLLNLLNQ